jgi:hypothetical protein
MPDSSAIPEHDTALPLPSSGQQGKVSSIFNIKDSYATLSNYIHSKPTSTNNTSNPVVKDLGTFNKLSDLQANGYGHDKQTKDYMEARQLKDPAKAPTNALRMAAVSGKIDRVKNSPEYKSLPPEYRVKVLGHYYDKYVSPVLKMNGIEPPSREEWLAGHGSNPEDKGTKSSTAGIAMSAMVSGQADMTRLVGNVLRYTIGDGTLPGLSTTSRDSSLSKSIDSKVKKVFDFADSLQKVSTDYDSTFVSRHDAGAWLANTGGHLIGDAPAYMVAGAAAEGIVPSMAEKAAISKGFKVGYQALKAGGEVFGVNEAEGKGFRESATAGIGAIVLAGTLSGAIARYGGAKLAIGGEPMAVKIAEDADHFDHTEGIEQHETTPNKPKALINPNDPDYKQAVNNERWLRERVAREFHPEKADAAGDKSVYRNLSTAQRIKIKDHIAAITKQSAELMPLVNPELQTVANTKELLTESISNPQFASRMAAIEKMTGLKVAEVLTKVQGDAVGRQTGLKSVAKDLRDSFGEPVTQDMMGENLSRTKGAKTVSNKGLLNPVLPTSSFIEGTTKYLEKNSATKSGHDYFENPEHHLEWVANHSDAPAPIKAQAFNRLRKDFNISHEEAVKKGQWLAEHVSDLRDTGKLNTEGNIYRSTKVTQRRYGTEWQHQLYEEDILKSDLDELKKLTRAKPELKAPIEEMLKTLTELRNKASTPLTSRLRRTTQKELIDTLSRYK